MTATESLEDESAPSADSSTPADIVTWFSPGNAIAYLFLALVSAIVVGLTSSTVTEISVFDEASHVDYAMRVAQLQLPRAGDHLSEPALLEWACRGSAFPSAVLPPCDSGPFRPVDFPVYAYQYNHGHPPLYYLVTGALTRGLVAVTDLGFVTVARLLGAVWLAAGLMVLFQVMRRMGLPHGYALAASGALAVTPTVAEFSSFVTNDAAALLCGALVAFVTVEVVHGRAGWPTVAVVAVLVILTKAVFVVALIGAAVVWLLVARGRRGAARRRLVGLAAVLGFASLLPYVAWSRFQQSRAEPGWRNPVLGINTRTADSLPTGQSCGTS